MVIYSINFFHLEDSRDPHSSYSNSHTDNVYKKRKSLSGEPKGFFCFFMKSHLKLQLFVNSK